MEVGRVRVTTVPGRRSFALRILAGRYQGGAYPLREGREVVIGRHPDADLVLAEELTSRRHARIDWEGEAPVIEDLGSTNGTFVNGERVSRRLLQDGDRILVGGNILKLVGQLRAVTPDTGPSRAEIEQIETMPPARAAAMSGRIEEVGLPDVLQLFGASRKTGVLRLSSAQGSARIHLEAGLVTHVVLEGREGLDPHKAFLRTLAWKEGDFELSAADPAAPPGPSLDQPVEALLMESMRQLDELARMEAELPRRARLVMGSPPPGAMDQLGALELEMVDVALAAGTVEAALDQTPLGDLDAARILAGLVRKGVLRRA